MAPVKTKEKSWKKTKIKNPGVRPVDTLKIEGLLSRAECRITTVDLLAIASIPVRKRGADLRFTRDLLACSLARVVEEPTCSRSLASVRTLPFPSRIDGWI